MASEPLFPYQEAQVQELVNLALPNRLFIGWDMGLGKTRLCIEVARRRGFQRILVVGPAIARVVWPLEQKKWRATGDWAFASWTELSTQGLGLVNWVRKYKPDLVVLDEAHAAKSRAAKRTRVAYGRACDGGADSLVHGVPLVIALSGTPAPNYTAELWTHLNALAPHTIHHHATGRPLGEHQFRELYAQLKVGNFGVQVIGSKNTDQLRTRTSSFFRRLRKEQVLKDLPPLMIVEEPLTVDRAAVPVEFRDPGLGAAFSDDELIDWLNTRTTSLASARRLLGSMKLTMAIEWIENFLEASDRKLVVFAHHLGVIEHLVNHFKGQVVSITGSSTDRVRAAALQLFHNDARTRLFVGQTLACGSVITLTAAWDVVVLEPDWTPANIAQAIARTHRIGQRNAVLARLFYVPDTLDEVIAGVMARKAREISRMFDTPANTPSPVQEKVA